MADTAVQTHLERLRKPLHYAMRHNFAHLATLRDLEPYVHHHVQALQGLTLPSALPPLLQQLAQTLCGFDTLPLLQKQMRLRQADTLLSQMHATLSAAPPATVAPPPAGDPLAQPVQYLRGVGDEDRLQHRVVVDAAGTAAADPAVRGDAVLDQTD